jgi:hypothetical protein
MNIDDLPMFAGYRNRFCIEGYICSSRIANKQIVTAVSVKF